MEGHKWECKDAAVMPLTTWRCVTCDDEYCYAHTQEGKPTGCLKARTAKWVRVYPEALIETLKRGIEKNEREGEE